MGVRDLRLELGICFFFFRWTRSGMGFVYFLDLWFVINRAAWFNTPFSLWTGIRKSVMLYRKASYSKQDHTVTFSSKDEGRWTWLLAVRFLFSSIP